MRITIEIDDEEVRRVLAPLVQQAPATQMQPLSRLLKVNEVADRLGVSRNKVYELLYRGEIQSLAIGRTRRIFACCSRRIHLPTQRRRLAR